MEQQIIIELEKTRDELNISVANQSLTGESVLYKSQIVDKYINSYYRMVLNKSN